jgi:hypothetical protein
MLKRGRCDIYSRAVDRKTILLIARARACRAESVRLIVEAREFSDRVTQSLVGLYPRSPATVVPTVLVLDRFLKPRAAPPPDRSVAVIAYLRLRQTYLSVTCRLAEDQPTAPTKRGVPRIPVLPDVYALRACFAASSRLLRV